MNELKVSKQGLYDFLITNGVKNRGALVKMLTFTHTTGVYQMPKNGATLQNLILL